MEKLVEKIRSKPNHKKNQIILVTLIIATMLLLGAWAIIGIPTRNNSSGDIIDQVNSDFKQNQNTLPDLFPKN